MEAFNKESIPDDMGLTLPDNVSQLTVRIPFYCWGDFRLFKLLILMANK